MINVYLKPCMHMKYNTMKINSFHYAVLVQSILLSVLNKPIIVFKKFLLSTGTFVWHTVK